MKFTLLLIAFSLQAFTARLVRLFHRTALASSASTNPPALTETVQVFSLPACKYCRMAKSLLSSLNVEFTNIDLSEVALPTLQTRSVERLKSAKMSTVPQALLSPYVFSKSL